jgi:hypothetical protein
LGKKAQKGFALKEWSKLENVMNSIMLHVECHFSRNISYSTVLEMQVRSGIGFIDLMLDVPE